MPLELPKLDDLTFQAIVDHAKGRISHYCPDWTDHNVHDPGIALIELFAEMTEMLLYRVNRIPESVHLTLLNLIGVQRRLPNTATAPVTFYLTAPAKEEVEVKKGTRISTIRTEASAPVIFTTTELLTIRPPTIDAAFILLKSGAHRPGQLAIDNEGRFERDSHLLDDIVLFRANSPEAGDAFYLGLKENHSHHVLALDIECVSDWRTTGVDIERKDAPTVWEVAVDQQRTEWAPCEVEEDNTLYLSRNGTITLRLPGDLKRRPLTELERMPLRSQQVQPPPEAYWLRCRLLHTYPDPPEAPETGTAADAAPNQEAARPNTYTSSPRLRRLQTSVIGGTVPAQQAQIVENEYLGQSDGSPGQMFRLRHAPVLSLGAEEVLLVTSSDGTSKEEWREVTQFADSRLEELQGKGFVLDHFTGMIVFPPVLPQPQLPESEPGVYRFGGVPGRDSKLVFTQYRYWDGQHGTVQAGALRDLQPANGQFRRVTNWQPAEGGGPAETIEAVKLRAAREFRTRRGVAVTADDFEYLALKEYEPTGDELGRAYCIAPDQHEPNGTEAPSAKPGQVRVVLFPRVKRDLAAGFLPPELLVLPEDVREKIQRKLSEIAVLGCRVAVEGPRLVPVTIKVTVVARSPSTHSSRKKLAELIIKRLNHYLNPYVGGPDESGWPFGRSVTADELRGVIQMLPGVERVQSLAGADPAIQFDQVIRSGEHRVEALEHGSGS